MTQLFLTIVVMMITSYGDDDHDDNKYDAGCVGYSNEDVVDDN